MQTQTNKTSLNGRYKIVFKNYYTTYNYINFKDKNCEFLIDHFRSYVSTIEYGKTISIIKTPQSNILIQFKTSEISKDTIPFTVHNTNTVYINYLHITIANGKLIKN